MRKIIFIFLSVLFVATPVVVFAQNDEMEFDPHATASAAPKVEQVNSYDLFWPIVAGKTRGNKLYFAKIWKEKFREMLTFTNFKKADYNITLSDKRVVEAESLLNDSKFDNAQKTLADAQKKRDKAFNLIDKAGQDGDNTTDLKNALKSALEKQRALLIYLEDKLGSSDASGVIDKDLSGLNTTLEKLQ